MKDYGLVAPKLESQHYFFNTGRSLGKMIIRPDGNWEQFLPTYEPQFNEFYDTYGCTVWGTQNALETIYKQQKGEEINFSERFTYILAGITPPGADPHYVAETIRKQGLIEDKDLPFVSTYNEFLTPTPMTKELLEKGKKWLTQWEMGHEWVFMLENNAQRRLTLMKEALLYSPLCVSVTAWIKEGDYYIDQGIPNNHWCEVYKIDDKGIYVFDSYDQAKKVLSLKHNILWCKRYTLITKLDSIKEQLDVVQIMVNLLKKVIDLFTKKKSL